MAAAITSTEIGQALIAILVAVVGYVLHRKGEQIHVLVNSRLDEALGRIESLEDRLGLEPGEPLPPKESEKGAP